MSSRCVSPLSTRVLTIKEYYGGGVHPATHLSNYGIGLKGFSVSSGSSHGGGLHHGLIRTKVGAWMPRTVGVVLAH